MEENFTIRKITNLELQQVTGWAKSEGFAPGFDDISIYKNIDKEGIWVGCLENAPIGSISCVKYNKAYGFIGLFIVKKEFRKKGYGIKLWKHALNYLEDIECIGLEAAPMRLKDYQKWGFVTSSITNRWKLNGRKNLPKSNFYNDPRPSFKVVPGDQISSEAVLNYDSQREPSPRPHFLNDWLKNSIGIVKALVDDNNMCHGFGRIRPCMLQDNKTGWRIGPLLADTPPLAELLIRELVGNLENQILLDCPSLNPYANYLLSNLGFSEISKTYRMYKGAQPPFPMNQVYGLACLELG
tara:strand:- start:8051 stop:8941 length:891 start_codon:yes stop_codon:yes gene_type:complete